MKIQAGRHSGGTAHRSYKLAGPRGSERRRFCGSFVGLAVFLNFHTDSDLTMRALFEHRIRTRQQPRRLPRTVRRQQAIRRRGSRRGSAARSCPRDRVEVSPTGLPGVRLAGPAAEKEFLGHPRRSSTELVRPMRMGPGGEDVGRFLVVRSGGEGETSSW